MYPCIILFMAYELTITAYSVTKKFSSKSIKELIALSTGYLDTLQQTDTVIKATKKIKKNQLFFRFNTISSSLSTIS